jgi:hypothetical protein
VLRLPIMLQTGLRDAIVRYYEHARLAGQMRSSLCEQDQFLLQVTDSGHVGGSGDRAVRDLSEQMAFVVAHIEHEAPSVDMLLGRTGVRRAGERSDNGCIRGAAVPTTTTERREGVSTDEFIGAMAVVEEGGAQCN